jgi:hypothetical protein
MDYLYAFLGGLLCKIYDDLNDNGMIGEHSQELLRGSQWILLTLLSYKDFNFSIFAYIANGLNAISNWNEWNHPYETSLLLLYPFLLVISFSTISWLNVYDYIFVVIWIVGMFLEPYIVPEEFSYKKLILRIFGCFFASFAIFIGSILNVSQSLIKICIYGLGYSLFSSGFQAYLLMNRR